MISIDPLAGAAELAKPVFGTLCKIYKTRKDKACFRDMVKEACLANGQIDAAKVDEISDDMVKALEGILLDASPTRIRRILWRVRIDRGPGIDRLPSAELQHLIDTWYQDSIKHLGVIGAPMTISGAFMVATYNKAFKTVGPKAIPARKLMDALEQNDASSEHWAPWMTVGSGLAATGTAGALATGIAGAADTDLKTAFTILVGTAITVMLTKLVHYLGIPPATEVKPRQQNADHAG